MPKKEKQDIVLTNGLDLKSPDEVLDPRSARKLENVVLDRNGVPSKLEGYVKYNQTPLAEAVTGLHELAKDDGSRQLLAFEGGRLHTSPGDGTFTQIESGLNTIEEPSFATARNRAYYGQGLDARSTDGVTARDMGLLPPPAGMTVATGAGGSPNGDYYYKVSFLYDGFQESSLSPETAQITLTNQQGNLSNIPIGPAGTTARKIYRTLDGGSPESTHFLVGTVDDNTTTTFIDNFDDTDLRVPGLIDVLPLTNSGTFLRPRHLIWHGQRLWLSGITGQLDTVYMSDVAEPDKFRATNFFRTAGIENSIVTGIWPFFDMVVVFTDTSVNVIRGIHNAEITSMRFDNIVTGIGCNDSRSIQTITVNGVPQVVFADNQAYYSFNGSTVQRFSDPIEPDFQVLAQVTATPGTDTQTTFADFLAGNSSPSIDLNDVPGSVRVGTDKEWDTTIDFQAGIFGTGLTANLGSVVTDGNAPIFDDFSDGDFTNNPTWSIVAQGTFDTAVVSGNQLVMTANNATAALGPGIDLSTPSTNYDGVWEADIQVDNLGGGNIAKLTRWHFMEDGAGNGYNLLFAWATNIVALRVSTGFSESTILNLGSIPAGLNTWRIERVGSNFEVFKNGVSQGSVSNGTHNSSTQMRWETQTGSAFSSNRCIVDNIKIGGTANWESDVADSTVDKTSWGVFTATDFSPTSESVEYAIRSGNTPTPDGSWTSYSSITSGSNILEPGGNRYIQVRATLGGFILTSPSRVDNIVITWGATGTFTGPSIDTGANGPAGWNTFVADITSEGAGLTFEIRSDSAPLPADPNTGPAFVALTNETIPTLGTGTSNRYVQWKAELVATPADDSVQLDAVTTQWFIFGQGDVGRMSSKWFNDRLWFSARTTTNSTTNDIMYLFDRFGRWTTGNIKAHLFQRFFDDLFFAGVDEPATAGFIFKFDRNIFTRDGQDVTSTIETGNKAWVEDALADNRKLFRTLWFNTSSTEDFSVSAQPDESVFSTPITVAGGQSQSVHVNTHGKRQKLRIEHTGGNDFILWKFSPITFVYAHRKG